MQHLSQFHLGSLCSSPTVLPTTLGSGTFLKWKLDQVSPLFKIPYRTVSFLLIGIDNHFLIRPLITSRASFCTLVTHAVYTITWTFYSMSCYILNLSFCLQCCDKGPEDPYHDFLFTFSHVTAGDRRELHTSLSWWLTEILTFIPRSRQTNGSLTSSMEYIDISSITSNTCQCNLLLSCLWLQEKWHLEW